MFRYLFEGGGKWSKPQNPG